jgi:sortase A
MPRGAQLFSDRTPEKLRPRPAYRPRNVDSCFAATGRAHSSSHFLPMYQTLFAIKPKRTLLHTLERFCWILGFLATVTFVAARLDLVRFQDSQSARLVALQQTATAPQSNSQTALTLAGDPLGRISIPRLALSATIAQGIDAPTLRRAVGHFPETPALGSPGTVVLAAHRDTFFRPLAHIHLNDVIVLDTPRAEYRYKVVHTFVVDPSHTEVLQSSPASDLTLITCYPFHYIGPAPKRFIVQALRLPPEAASQN